MDGKGIPKSGLQLSSVFSFYEIEHVYADMKQI